MTFVLVARHGRRRADRSVVHRLRFWLRSLGHLADLCRDEPGAPDWPRLNALVDQRARRVPLPLPLEADWFARYYDVEGALEDYERAIAQLRAAEAAAKAEPPL